MCGIAGIFYRDREHLPRAETIKAMCEKMKNRGPDDEGYRLEPGIALGHRRLSIIDIEKGTQPLSNETGSVRVVFNGEIYNHKELRRELKALEHVFKTHCDTEVIVHAYEEYGTECFSKFRGMFAVAVYDGEQRKLILARDRVGQKPLFYTETSEALIFASTLDGLLAYPGINPEIDPNGLGEYLQTGVITAPGTIFKNCKSILPGHYLTIDDKPPAPLIKGGDVCFWKADYRIKTKITINDLYEIIKESVALHTESEVPLGVFLSGGIDSSLITMLLSDAGISPLKTFSVGFADNKYNELEYAKIVANICKTEHKEIILESPDAEKMIHEVAMNLDQPLGDSSAIPTYLISKAAKEYVTVILGGDGGDELFAGYPYYKREKLRRYFQTLPDSLNKNIYRKFRNGKCGFSKFISDLSGTSLQLYNRWRECFSIKELEKLKYDLSYACKILSWENHFNQFPDINSMEKMMYADLMTYVPDDLMVKVDRMSMAHSLEVRVPLLDHVVIESAAMISPILKLNGNISKYILKKILSGKLPQKIIGKRKQGFAIPVHDWLRNDLRELVGDTLLSSKSILTDYMDQGNIRELVYRHWYSGENMGHKIWTLLMFVLWDNKRS